MDAWILYKFVPFRRLFFFRYRLSIEEFFLKCKHLLCIRDGRWSANFVDLNCQSTSFSSFLQRTVENNRVFNFQNPPWPSWI